MLDLCVSLWNVIEDLKSRMMVDERLRFGLFLMNAGVERSSGRNLPGFRA